MGEMTAPCPTEPQLDLQLSPSQPQLPVTAWVWRLHGGGMEDFSPLRDFLQPHPLPMAPAKTISLGHTSLNKAGPSRSSIAPEMSLAEQTRRLPRPRCKASITPQF